MKKLIILFSIAAFALCGCSKSDNKADQASEKSGEQAIQKVSYDFSDLEKWEKSVCLQAKKEGMQEYKIDIFYKELEQELVNITKKRFGDAIEQETAMVGLASLGAMMNENSNPQTPAQMQQSMEAVAIKYFLKNAKDVMGEKTLSQIAKELNLKM